MFVIELSKNTLHVRQKEECEWVKPREREKDKGKGERNWIGIEDEGILYDILDILFSSYEAGEVGRRKEREWRRYEQWERRKAERERERKESREKERDRNVIFCRLSLIIRKLFHFLILLLLYFLTSKFNRKIVSMKYVLSGVGGNVHIGGEDKMSGRIECTKICMIPIRIES
jgi:hypothetical protein